MRVGKGLTTTKLTGVHFSVQLTVLAHVNAVRGNKAAL